MTNRWLSAFALLSLLFVSGPTASPALEMRGDTIYLMVPDRFFDGDSSNNTAVDPTLYSAGKTDWQKYWGGDLAGIKQKLEYLQSIGVTTVWVTPIYQNAPVPGTYHGYQMQDLFRVDPHFGSFPVVDSLTCDMHARGMKLMLDTILNAGPATAAGVPSGSQCLLKKDGVVKARYLQDTDGWFHHFGPIDFNNFTYPDQVTKDIFGLADLNQDNADVRDYLKQGYALWQYHGVDCFRLDAAKHYEPAFAHEWMDSANQVARWLGKPGTYAVAEWYGGGAWNGESLWWSSTAGAALLDFQLQEKLRGVAGEWASMYELRDVLYSRHTAYGLDGSGGQNVHWQVNIFDSHDTQRLIVPLLQRYGSAKIGEVHERIAMTLALLEMAPGIPCVFYGEEQYLHDDTVNGNGIAGGDPYNRPQMTTFDTGTLAAQTLKAASDLRRIHPAVQYGDIVERWIDSGLLVFSRQAGSNAVLVGVNNGWESRTVSVSGIPFPNGSFGNVLGSTGSISAQGGSAAVTVPARSAVIFSYLPSPISPESVVDGRCERTPPSVTGPAPSASIVLDGASITADFAGKGRGTQVNPTAFGDSSGAAGGSELDQLFVTNDSDNLYIGLTGNLEQNGNYLLVFLETGPSGVKTVSASAGPSVVGAISGTKMDDGFSPRWLLAISSPSGGVFYADLIDLTSNTHRFLGAGSVNSGSAALTGGDAPAGEMIAFNNANSAGVTSAAVAAANTATTGFEIKLPFPSLVLQSATVRVMAVVTGASGYFSNQSLPGMGGSSAGSVGGYANLGSGPIDFGMIAGTQYLMVALSGVSYTPFSSLAQAKSQPDGTRVNLTGQVGIGAFSFISSFYMQDPDEWTGVRVVKPTSPIAEMGQAVTSAKGFLSTQDGERVLLAAELTLGGAAALPRALGMSNLSLGGGPTGGNVGIDGALGPGNTGIQVFTWGRVTCTGSDAGGNRFFYIDDGSGIADGSIVSGSPARGVRVYCSLVFPSVGDMVIAKGVSGVEYVGGKSQRRVLARQPSDVTIVH